MSLSLSLRKKMLENLSSIQIEKIVQSDPRMVEIFYGVFSSNALEDAVPILLQRTTPISLIIVNSVPSRVKTGGHWLSFCIFQARSEILFLDSLGGSPSDYSESIANFAHRWFPRFDLITFPRPLQSDNSLLCGLYLMYWMKKLAHGQSPDTLIRSFSPSDRVENDRFLLRWASKHLFHSEIVEDE